PKDTVLTRPDSGIPSLPEIPGSAREEKPRSFFLCFSPASAYERDTMRHSLDAAGAETRSAPKPVVDPGIRAGRNINVVVSRVRRHLVAGNVLDSISERDIGLYSVSVCAVIHPNSVVFVKRRCIVLHEIVLGSGGIRRHIERVHVDPIGVELDDIT